MSDYPMLISNKLHSFRNFFLQIYAYSPKNNALIKNYFVEWQKVRTFALG